MNSKEGAEGSASRSVRGKITSETTRRDSICREWKLVGGNAVTEDHVRAVDRKGVYRQWASFKFCFEERELSLLLRTSSSGMIGDIDAQQLLSSIWKDGRVVMACGTSSRHRKFRRLV